MTQQFADKSALVTGAGSSHEIATVVAFLVSAEASYVTGAHIAVDGGFLA